MKHFIEGGTLVPPSITYIGNGKNTEFIFPFTWEIEESEDYEVERGNYFSLVKFKTAPKAGEVFHLKGK